MSIISEKLEDIRNYLDVEVHPVVSPDRWDVYSTLCDMVDDIIALLKAREPRVLRVEEVVSLKQNDVVWLEDYNKKNVIPAIVSRMGPMVVCIEFALSDRYISVGYDDYGSRWRCWSSRPTDEQREAIPWEG